MKRSIMKLNNLWAAVYAGVLLLVAGSALAEDPPEKFPDRDSSYMQEGTFVSTENLRNMGPGLSKTQVYDLLGVPHFHEGVFNVRVWNYIFNFRTGKNNEYVTCQFMVNYDSNYHVASTHWKDPDCQKYVNPPGSTTVLADQPYHQRVTLAADGLFAFGKSGLADLTGPGREKIDSLVSQLKQDGVKLTSVVVTGHTDRIGTETANFTLSKARAETIRSYLVQQGLDDKAIKAYGAGLSQPLVQCEGEAVTPQLVQCLQPNRRVEIEVLGEK
ncbi:OmpA family protein [Collimonas humicola]|uniref:OmpA family protein n=1 Tax=Collimonas humicola TaxID=2825886 RepID=UPI001B8C3C0C|nr:OmpA family protein [Collimonas humicola]